MAVRALAFVAAFMLAALAGCDADEQRAKLAGTWETTFESRAAAVHSTYVLHRDGKFTEHFEAVEATGDSQTIEFAGQWLTNGESLTLRYLEEDGRHFSGRYVRFQTFLLVSVRQDEFVGRDELGGRTLTFRRVQGRVHAA